MKVLRASLVTAFGSLTLLWASAAFAAGEACFNDDDCPGGGAVCGGDVCNWTKPHPMATGDKPYTCNPAGTDPKGRDGWCTDDSDCKCKAEGATCKVPPYCTFTKPSDAPPAGGTGAGGSSGTSGSTSTAGTGTATAGTGSTPAPADDGGCSVSAPGGSAGGVLAALGLLGLGATLARRRR
jgi:MYXO-CTERM domain-containing protein